MARQNIPAGNIVFQTLRAMLNGNFTELYALFADNQDAIGTVSALITTIRGGSDKTIKWLEDKLDSHDALMGSNDLTLDTVQEIVTYIKANKSLIDSVSTNKLNKSVYDAFIAQYANDIAAKVNRTEILDGNGKFDTSKMPVFKLGAGLRLNESLGEWEIDLDYVAANLGTTTPGDTTPPAKPTGLSATKTATTIALTWPVPTDNTGVTGYDVDKDGTVTAFGTNSANFSGLTASTAYNLRVRAKDAYGNVSEWSDVLIVTTEADTPYVVEQTLRLNFGGQYGAWATANYNNIRTDTSSAVFQNAYNSNPAIVSATPALYNTSGVLTSITVAMSAGFSGASNNAPVPPTAGQGLFEDTVHTSYWFIYNGTTGKIKIGGLNVGKSFNLAIYGNGNTVDGTTSYKIGTTTVNHSSYNNFGAVANRTNPFADSATTKFYNIHPNSNGEIEIEVINPGVVSSFINALVIQQQNKDKAI